MSYQFFVEIFKLYRIFLIICFKKSHSSYALHVMCGGRRVGQGRGLGCLLVRGDGVNHVISQPSGWPVVCVCVEWCSAS